jgi:hypothetical protein
MRLATPDRKPEDANTCKGILSEMRHTGEMPHGAARRGTAQERFERQQ